LPPAILAYIARIYGIAKSKSRPTLFPVYATGNHRIIPAASIGT
jgi:hypothetical protein